MDKKENMNRLPKLHFYGENPEKYRDVVVGQEKTGMMPVELVTMRRSPKEYQAGDQVWAVFNEGDVEGATLQVVLQVTAKIKDIPPGIALLDGCFDTARVVKMMEGIYAEDKNGKPFTKNSEVTYTLFVPAWMLSHLGENENQKLQNVHAAFDPDHHLSDLELSNRVISDPELSKIFFWSFYIWLTDFYYIQKKDYPQELAKRGLISDTEKEKMEEFYQQYLAQNPDDENPHQLFSYITALHY